MSGNVEIEKFHLRADTELFRKLREMSISDYEEHIMDMLSVLDDMGEIDAVEALNKLSLQIVEQVANTIQNTDDAFKANLVMGVVSLSLISSFMANFDRFVFMAEVEAFGESGTDG